MTRHKQLKRYLQCWQVHCLLLCVTLYSPLSIAAIEQDFSQEIEQLAPYENVAVIVTMKEMVRPESLSSRSISTRDGNLVKALKQHAKSSQVGIKSFIKSQGIKSYKDIWIVNGLAVTVRADQVRKLATQPGVVSVRKDAVVTFATPPFTTASVTPEWNLTALHLPELWAAGNTGQGVVVATMDTGVDISHPDIANKWRGGNNSWFDPHGQHATPYDSVGHGTQVMGILVGGNASGVKIGAAPDAQYIAAKIFNDNGKSSYSAIHASFQWLLDPDNDPRTQDAPNVVNASWGLPDSNNKCNIEFDTDIRMLKAANIAIVFAGGNDGPAPATGVSPASSAGVISSGAVASTLDISSFSSRGTSPCTSGIFPTLVAPGEGIYTADLTSGGLTAYTSVSGSSFAAPHVAGVLTLLAGKFPNLTVADLENSLIQTAQDMGEVGADNSYGVGLINANAALLALTSRAPGSAPVVTSLPPVIAMQGVGYSYQVTASDADGDSLTYALDIFPAGMSIGASGQIFWVPGSNQVGQQLVTVRVTDATGLYAIQIFVVVVENVNNAPVANDDTYSMVQGASLMVPAGGVLTNDTDRDSNRLVAVNYGRATTGTLSGNEDGSFVYIPPSSAFSGIVTFTYQASDGALNSAAATVTINVLPATGSTLTLPTPLPHVNLNTPPMIFPSTSPVDNGVASTADAVQNSPEQNEVADRNKDAVAVKVADASKVDGERIEEDAPIISSLPNEVAKQGVAYVYEVTLANDTGSKHEFSLESAPESMTISEAGVINWIPKSKQVGKQNVVVRVTDSPKLFTRQSFTVLVENVNDAPVAVSDTFTVVQGATLNLPAPGILKNDTDADDSELTAVAYSLPSTGSLTGNPDGSFSYIPPSPKYLGPVTFTYKASDGELSSEVAVVTLHIVANHAPQLGNDVVNARLRLPVLAYTALPINVLENDVDPDSEVDPQNKIAPATLKIVTQPDKAGKIEVNSAGIISYTPAIGFKGIESFNYSVKDTHNAVSKSASVQVNVK